MSKQEITEKNSVVIFGESVLAELRGPSRATTFAISKDYFWENKGTQDSPKWEKTQEACLAMKIGNKSAHRFEPTKKNIQAIIDGLEMAKKELL